MSVVTIELIQPYRHPQGMISVLGLLGSLDIADKHKLLNVVTLMPDQVNTGRAPH